MPTILISIDPDIFRLRTDRVEFAAFLASEVERLRSRYIMDLPWVQTHPERGITTVFEIEVDTSFDNAVRIAKILKEKILREYEEIMHEEDIEVRVFRR